MNNPNPEFPSQPRPDEVPAPDKPAPGPQPIQAASNQGSTIRGPAIQGEGNYVAARRYRKDVKEFIETADIDKAARAARPKTDAERRELEAAETAGKARGKGDDAQRGAK